MPSTAEVDNIKSLDDSGQTSILTKTGTGGSKVFTLDNVTLGSGVTGAGAWVKLESQTISGTPNSVTIGWDSTGTPSTRFTSTYRIYKIICTSLKVTTESTSDIDFNMQVCHTGTTAYTGSTIDTGTQTTINNGIAWTVQRANDQNNLEHFGGYSLQGALATSSTNLEITVYDPSNTTMHKKLDCISRYTDAGYSTIGKMTNAYASVKAANAITALILYPLAAEAVTINNGAVINLYGVA